MKYPISCIALLSLFTLTGCSHSLKEEKPMIQDNQICSSQNLSGGWSQSDVTPEVTQALNLVISQMNTTAKSNGILSVRTQVVNGINYAIEFKTDNNEVWNAIVYRPIKGNMKVTKPAEQGRLCL